MITERGGIGRAGNIFVITETNQQTHALNRTPRAFPSGYLACQRQLAFSEELHGSPEVEGSVAVVDVVLGTNGVHRTSYADKLVTYGYRVEEGLVVEVDAPL